MSDQTNSSIHEPPGLDSSSPKVRIVPKEVGGSDCPVAGLDESLGERLLERMRIEVQNIIRDVEGEIEEHSLQLVEVWNHVIQDSNFKVQIADLKREVTYLQVAVARMVQQKEQQSCCSNNVEVVEPNMETNLQQNLQGGQVEQSAQQAAFDNLGEQKQCDKMENTESASHMAEWKQNSQGPLDERQQADLTTMTCIMDQTITQMASTEAAILKLQQDVSIQQKQHEVQHQVSKKMIADIWWEITKIQLEMNERMSGSLHQTPARLDAPNLRPDAGDHPCPPSRTTTPVRFVNDSSKPVGESRSLPAMGMSYSSTLPIHSVVGGGKNMMSRTSRPPPAAVGGQARKQGSVLVPATPRDRSPRLLKTSRDMSPIDHSSRGVTPTRRGFLHNVPLGLPRSSLHGGSSTISIGRAGGSMTYPGFSVPSRRENSPNRSSSTPLQASCIHPSTVMLQQAQGLTRLSPLGSELNGCGPHSATPCCESSASKNGFTPGQLSGPLLSQLKTFAYPEVPNACVLA